MTVDGTRGWIGVRLLNGSKYNLRLKESFTRFMTSIDLEGGLDSGTATVASPDDQNIGEIGK